MYKGCSLSLVIPCRNEEKALAKMLPAIPKWIDEVIVVDNNSSDRTYQVAEKLGAKVLLEKRAIAGIGYGFAHQRGMKVAKGDIIVTMDGDNTYPIRDIKPAVNYLLRKQLDMVSCNRYPLKKGDAVSSIRQLGVWILNHQVRWLYRYPMKDILSGMWVIRRKAMKELKLVEGGWNFSPEVKLASIMSPQVCFGEFHIAHDYRFDGDSKQNIWKTGLEHFWYIGKRRFTTDNLIKFTFAQSARSYLPSFK